MRVISWALPSRAAALGRLVGLLGVGLFLALLVAEDVFEEVEVQVVLVQVERVYLVLGARGYDGVGAAYPAGYPDVAAVALGVDDDLAVALHQKAGGEALYDEALAAARLAEDYAVGVDQLPGVEGHRGVRSGVHANKDPVLVV